MDAAGNLYGTTVFGGSAGTEPSLRSIHPITYSVLYSFTGGSDGGDPQARSDHGRRREPLRHDGDGGSGNGKGTVFKIDTSNNESVLYSFQGGNDGGSAPGSSDHGRGREPLRHDISRRKWGLPPARAAGPSLRLTLSITNLCSTVSQAEATEEIHQASVVMDAEGNLYGTTSQGGIGVCAPAPGCGTVFEFPMDDDSNYAVLNGNNIFNGNQTVNGLVSATMFMGNGSSLTNINPANIAMGTANISILGNAATATNAITATLAKSALDATNADNLGGVPAASFARLDIGNAFTGNQSVNGNETLAGSVSIGNGTAITKHLSALFNPSFPVLGKGTCATASFAYNGVSDGDTTALGVPNARAAGPGNFVYTAWASAANTITIQGCNVSGTNQTTAGSGSIRVDVWKH